MNCIEEDGANRSVAIADLPGVCPICHKSVMPEVREGFFKWYSKKQSSILQVVFRCSDFECKSVFIGYYVPFGSYFVLDHSQPYSCIKIDFPKVIEWFSKDFIEIYNQAYAAEQLGLGEICGAGYRKALEFLVKDYLITKSIKQEIHLRKDFLLGYGYVNSKSLPRSKKSQTIREMHLGKLIETKVRNSNIKQVAKRAVWIGNDETHFERRWTTKDVGDLKDLINLTVRWIELTEATGDFIREMPDGMQ